jgi:hypothetical protein
VSGLPRPTIAPCPATGKATASSVSTARRSGHSSSGPPGSRCCCTCPPWTATVTDLESTTGRRSPATAPRPSATPSPHRSPRSPTSCVARSPGTRAPNLLSTLSCASTAAWTLLLRTAQPVAARHQREHQRPAAPVLPQGHRPLATPARGSRRRRSRAQRPAPQDARLEDPRRSPQRASTLGSARQRCDDPLNLGFRPQRGQHSATVDTATPRLAGDEAGVGPLRHGRPIASLVAVRINGRRGRFGVEPPSVA